MRRWAATLAAALSAAVPVAAQEPAREPARLRAGEHSGFSRLAFDVPGLGDWRVEVEGRRLNVAFPDRRLDFDVRQIWPGRRVTRATSVRAAVGEDGTELSIGLSCDCLAQAYRFGDDMLVVDLSERVEDGPPAADERGETFATGSSAEPSAATGVPPAASGSRGPRAGQAPRVPPPQPAAEAPASPARLSVEEARRRLLEQLSRAADQGLVTLRDPEPDRVATVEGRETTLAREQAPGARIDEAREAGSAAEPASAPRSDPAPPSAPSEAPDAAVHLEARTAFDPMPWPPLSTPEAPPLSTPEAPPPGCPPEIWLDAQRWADGAAPDASSWLDRIAARRAALVGELDRPSPEAALAIARLQIGLGLGAEARQMLDVAASAGSETDEIALLDELSRVVDRDPVPSDGALAKAAGCGGAAVIWRLAAGMAPAQDAEALPQNVVSAFERAPLPLRRLLAAPALETLLAARRLDAAETLRLRLDRAPGDHGSEWRLASARLALATGDVARGEAGLERIAAGGDRSADAAMLALALRRLDRGERLEAETIERLGAAATARRGERLGRRLLVAELRARAGKGELAALFDAAAGRLGDGPAEAAEIGAALRETLETVSAAEVGPARFAEAVTAHGRLLGEDAAWDAARLRLAGELTGIGLPNLALQMLAPPLSRDVPRARIAAARVEAAMWRPEAALARLDAAASDPETAWARAAALSAAGRHGAAFDALAAAGAGGAPPELAFRGGRWAAAAAAESRLGRIAEWMNGPPPAPWDAETGEGAPSLAAVRAALESAAADRALVEEILEDG